ncbi:MAG TPA: Pr6Pr family membrane protein, partial [Rhizomicrobium sp.]
YGAAVALHDIAPVMTIVGWAIFARGRNIFISTIFLALILPAIWLAITLIRYAIIDWVPYPFLDASRHGWPHVVLVLAMILSFQMALGFAALAWDKFVAAKRA